MNALTTILALVILALTAAASPAQSGTIEWTGFVGSAIDGSDLIGERTTIQVPERRDLPDHITKTIDLAIVRFRTTNPNAGPPIFVFAGGPGGSGIEAAALTASHPQIRLLEHADVIGVDQRGTGESAPNLFDPVFNESLPLDRPLTREQYIASSRRAARKTAEYWQANGVDLAGFTTRESADDFNQVRRALGYDKIVLYGASYGSHLALTYLRRHGDSVERAVLLNVEGPNHTWKLPSTVQRQIENLETVLTGDPAWTGQLPLQESISRLLNHLASNRTVARDVDGAVVISPFDLQAELSQRLGSVAAVAELPALFRQWMDDDWTSLIGVARENRRPGIAAMPLMMDCASGGTAERVAQLKTESADPGNILGDAILIPVYPQVCPALFAGLSATTNPLDPSFREAISSDVPVLFVSGALDVRTPPQNVERIAAGFSRSTHIVATNASHDSRQFMSSEFRELLQRFLRGETVEAATLQLPEPIFKAALGAEN